MRTKFLFLIILLSALMLALAYVLKPVDRQDALATGYGFASAYGDRDLQSLATYLAPDREDLRIELIEDMQYGGAYRVLYEANPVYANFLIQRPKLELVENRNDLAIIRIIGADSNYSDLFGLRLIDGKYYIDSLGFRNYELHKE